MGFISGIKYKSSRKSAENLFPNILALAKVWDLPSLNPRLTQTPLLLPLLGYVNSCLNSSLNYEGSQMGLVGLIGDSSEAVFPSLPLAAVEHYVSKINPA